MSDLSSELAGRHDQPQQLLEDSRGLERASQFRGAEIVLSLTLSPNLLLRE